MVCEFLGYTGLAQDIIVSDKIWVSYESQRRGTIIYSIDNEPP